MCIIFSCTMNLFYVPSLVKWYMRKTVTQSAPVIQRQALSVKSIPALKAPNAKSRKESWHATTQVRHKYCVFVVTNYS